MEKEIGVLILSGFAVIALLLSQNFVRDAVYNATKYWKEVGFVLVCAVIGGIFAMKHDAMAYQAHNLQFRIQLPEEKTVASTIRECKSFLEARVQGQNFEKAIKPTLISYGSTPVERNWEVCAKTFGMNYWKYDISINGQDGGRLLCETYAHEPTVSGKVLVWCETVFAPEHKV